MGFGHTHLVGSNISFSNEMIENSHEDGLKLIASTCF